MSNRLCRNFEDIDGLYTLVMKITKLNFNFFLFSLPPSLLPFLSFLPSIIHSSNARLFLMFQLLPRCWLCGDKQSHYDFFPHEAHNLVMWSNFSFYVFFSVFPLWISHACLSPTNPCKCLPRCSVT